MKNVVECFDIKGFEVVSVVGAGGKTSLIFYLANKIDGNVVITTSTKMRYPRDYNVIIDDEINFDNRIIVTAKATIEDKIAGVNEKIFANKDWNCVLIEADGSKMKPLKGWGEHEPVIIKESSKTIGVIDITTLGMEVNKENIFRLEEFGKITEANGNVTIQNLSDVVKNSNGLFKNTVGARIVFINKVESEELKEKAIELGKKIYDFVDIIIMGSIKDEYFEVLKGDYRE